VAAVDMLCPLTMLRLRSSQPGQMRSAGFRSLPQSNAALCQQLTSLFAHHLAGVWRLLRTQRPLQLAFLCFFVEFIPAALAGIWRARPGIRHTLSSLAFSTLAKAAIGLWDGLPALTSPWVALVLQDRRIRIF
jgi:hypothetical protein